MRPPVDLDPRVNALALLFQFLLLLFLRIELRGKLVQIAICAGFKLFLQLLDCGTGCGKSVQGSLILLQRGGQRLLQRVRLIF